MKETMYSGVDTHDKTASLIWVCGHVMAVSTDLGEEDSWRLQDPEATDRIGSYPTLPLDLDRFTDLTVVWERG